MDGANISSDQFSNAVKVRHESGLSFSSDEIEGMSDDQYNTVLNDVASMQRGIPESQMLATQRTVGGGLWGNSLEHIGDLTHRGQEHYATQTGYSSEFVKSKVESQLDHLTHGYGYDREVDEQIESNRRYDAKRGESFASDKEIEAQGQMYATAHTMLPTYTQPMRDARSAAVNIGLRNTEGAIKHLTNLKNTLDSGEYEQQMSREASVAFLRNRGM